MRIVQRRMRLCNVKDRPKQNSTSTSADHKMDQINRQLLGVKNVMRSNLGMILNII